MATHEEKLANIDEQIAKLQAKKAELQAEKDEIGTVVSEATAAQKDLASDLHEQFCDKPHNTPGGCWWQTLEDGTPDWSHPTNAHWLKKAKKYKKK